MSKGSQIFSVRGWGPFFSKKPSVVGTHFSVLILDLFHCTLDNWNRSLEERAMIKTPKNAILEKSTTKWRTTLFKQNKTTRTSLKGARFFQLEVEALFYKETLRSWNSLFSINFGPLSALSIALWTIEIVHWKRELG